MRMESAPLHLDADENSIQSPSGSTGDSRQRNAIILFPTGADLPEGWQTPWIKAGWLVSRCASSARIPQALQGPGASALVAAPWGDSDKPISANPALDGLADLSKALDAANDSKPAPPALMGGSLRRADFFAQLANIGEMAAGALCVLMSVRVDQAALLAEQLGRTEIFELEEALNVRIAEVLESGDAITLWLDFGFGVLVQRDEPAQVEDLARAICAGVAERPFLIKGEEQQLTVSLGLSLAPAGQGGDPSLEWFASAHAAQGIAARHGGSRFAGLLTREFEPMSAERVLIIREWVEEAKSATNVLVEFQPLLPAGASAGAVYSVHAKLRDHRAPLGGVYRREYLRLARAAGSMVMIDRISLFRAFEALGQEHRSGRETCLMVAVEIDTLKGVAWRWLVEELKRQPHLRQRLILELEASPALHEQENLLCIVRLRRLGVRVCVCDRSKDTVNLSSWTKLPVDFLRLHCGAVQAAPAAEFEQAVASWRAKGRHLIVSSVKEAGAVSHLASLGVDYLRGQALAATGPRLDYDFPVSI